ncbi:MAG: tetratricopeptide repeat protein [Acidobacteria bacterium]|nr:tetratricopeptide repeat protein [Acidobacteriota bacterium]
MDKLLIIAVVVVLSFVPVNTASAQARFNKDNSSSSDTYSESKRLYAEGVKYALAGLFSQAAQLFQQAVKMDPQFADAHFALGHAYYDMGHWKLAVESFKRAVDLNPQDLEAQDRLSYARDMLAKEDGKKQPPVPRPLPGRQPAGEQVSLTAKPASPPVNTVKSSNTEANAAAKEAAVKEAAAKEAAAKEAAAKEAAAKEAAAKEAAAKELALTKVYRVGPGDVLDIRINDATAPQSTLFTVTPAGLLEHPILAEPMQVGGLSVEEISANIESDLKRRALMESPKVSVAVRDYASHTILVSGLVKDSGTKVLRREAIPLYVVVADAQPLPEAAKVTVVRSETNQTYEMDLAQPAEMNLLVRPGDVITLHANATQFLYIGGEVKSPGEKTYRRGLTLTQALLAAGGATNKAKEARLGRDDGKGYLTVTTVKLKDIESGKIPDPLVRPGDRIMIID